MPLNMKRLIVCLDGTWNTPDHPGKITNVVKIMRAIRPHDDNGIEQIVYYDKGVGTANLVDKITGGMLGRGLDDNIKDGYRFQTVGMTTNLAFDKSYLADMHHLNPDPFGCQRRRENAQKRRLGNARSEEHTSELQSH